MASAWGLIAASLLCAAPTPGFAATTNHEAQVSGKQADAHAEFLASYAAWAKGIEAEGQARGTPLTAEQFELARQVGIAHPEKVRLVHVETVPFPTHDEAMRKMGESLGFIGPGITNNAQAFGYTIWVRDGFTLDRPSLAHELVHVAQIERSASFDAYVQRYMQELQTYGHARMPLEVEAYEANRTYR
ncbi:hypothetical protein [Novosphingobium mangrovi (ex Hu et al. 2023)]|uniref:DUF4157 domain-containing protein n=1 Tax=Novosphingobium mangrovi (ex Hu et al. 2023) TaxID=2930094 RepID=A0ABT0AE64_9SPHN|nr:hypothetical protein [Novosphingobium mangrovi (ex Hu et al. 2023)]MCJ1961491.1 hypothetical protein [Novosphingobium mangrovi (ex Hu et al. 2023)]